MSWVGCAGSLTGGGWGWGVCALSVILSGMDFSDLLIGLLLLVSPDLQDLFLFLGFTCLDRGSESSVLGNNRVIMHG